MRKNENRLSYFSRQGVGRQLRSLYIVAIILPVSLIGMIVYLFSYRQLAQNYEHLTAMKARHVRSVLTTSTLSLQDIYSDISEDTDLRELLAQDYASADDARHALMAYNKLEQVVKKSSFLTDLRLYVNQDILKDDTNFTYFYPITEDVKNTDWYIQASKTRGNFWRSSLREGKYGIQYWELNYYCHIPIPQTGSYAVLVMTVSNDHLHNLIQKDEYNIYISANSDPVFFSSDRSYAGKTFPFDLSQISSRQTTGKMSVDGQTTIGSAITLTPYNTDDQINILVTSTDAMYYIHRLGFGFGITSLFTLAISALIIFFYAKYFSARIQTLRLAMHKVSHNDYQIVNSIQGDDELTATFHDLTTMVAKLKENEKEIYESRIKEQMLYNQQQQMELKLLANQINPHFLYNTLETIRMMAFSAGNREVANAIKLLGKSMRYVLNNTKTTATTLDKEIDYIQNYLAIQKIRFGERLAYTIRIDKNLNTKNYQILPLLIQPIVENAYSHGLKDAEYNGHIIIKISYTEDLLIANIFDNGVGMTREKLDNVISHLDIPQPESDHGVGLYNINNRVHLYYGNEYGLTIQSRIGMGTLVTLTIPLINIREE